MVRYRFGLLGDPVEHSRSPELHRLMLEIAGMEGEYLKVRSDVAGLESAIDDLRTGFWDGLNTTMPLKTVAARLVDSLSPIARRCGSVNTLSSHDSVVHGESTDAVAFDQLFNSDRFVDMDTIYVLGAGGSAAAALAAVPENRHVYVTARRPERAETLTRRLGGQVATWGTAIAGALVVNTTPLGMEGETLPGSILAVASGLVDLPYGTRPTKAVAIAESEGIPSCDGHEFLLRQAIASFSVWTGVAIEYTAVVSALKNA